MWITEKAVKRAEEIREHWLRYFVELILVGILVWPALSWVHQVRNERLEEENAMLNLRIGDLQGKLQSAQLQCSQIPSLSAKCARPSPAACSELDDVKRELEEAGSLASRLREQRDTCLSSIRAKQERPLEMRTIVAESPPKPPYDCTSLRNSALALMRLKISFEATPEGSFSQRSSIGDLAASHVESLRKLHPDDAALQAALRKIKFSDGAAPSAMEAVLEQARGFAQENCPAVLNELLSEDKGTPLTDLRCRTAASVSASLTALRKSVSDSSSFTSKQHFLDVFNGLLVDAKSFLQSDQVVKRMDRLYAQGFHGSTRKMLLESIDLLSSRISRRQAECASLTSSPDGSKAGG